ncbi:MAG: pilin [Sterolibacterium sp.]
MQEEIFISLQVMKRQRGLKLIEWLIIVAVLGILATAIFPVYKTYTIRPKFADVMKVLAPYKAAIETCAKIGSCVVDGKLAGLGVGTQGVPPSISTTYLARVTVSPNGVITATANKVEGLAGETFILTPTLSNNAQITWTVSGTCKTREAGAIC